MKYFLLSCFLLAWPPLGLAEERIAIRQEKDFLQIETDALSARIQTRGYVSGVSAGSLIDKKTGTKDLGFGLHIMDFLLAPGWREDKYSREVPFHGRLAKHLVEGPQICTQAKILEPAITRGADFVAVQLRFKFTEAAPGLKAGSLWEQTLLFKTGIRYFFSAEEITSTNTVEDLFYRIDMPGHIKHKKGDTFEQVYLSYLEKPLTAKEFENNFAPDAKFLYQRDDSKLPARMIRAYKTRNGPWLAGLTLDPGATSEAWCHQRDYVCFIQELHKRSVKTGEKFGAAYIVGWFDSIPDMAKTYDEFKGIRKIEVDPLQKSFRIAR